MAETGKNLRAHDGSSVLGPPPVPSDSSDVSLAPPPRQWWQKRFVDPIVAQLTQGLTPEKIALTVAIGSAIAMFPLLGTTTLLCLIVGIFMRLNQPIIQAVNYACTPIHIPFIFYSFRWGARLFGETHSRLEGREMRRLLIEHPLDFVQRYSVSAFHAVVVWAILVPFWALAIYSIALPILKGVDRVRREAAAKLAAEKAKDHPVP
jgi:uncharacterized protein (DUF2062 family)